MDKGKKPHNSNKGKKLAKRTQAPWMDIECRYSWGSIKSVNLGYVERLAEKLDKWPEENPQAQSINEFYRPEGLTYDSYHGMVKKFPVLKKAHDEAKRELGYRLLKGSTIRQFDRSSVAYRLHDYAPEFKDQDAYNAQLKKDEQSSNNQIVVLDRTPDSKEVKPKVKKNE